MRTVLKACDKVLRERNENSHAKSETNRNRKRWQSNDKLGDKQNNSNSKACETERN